MLRFSQIIQNCAVVNPLVTAAADGSFLAEIRYTSFGEQRYANGQLVTDKLYTGQQQETEIGLDYYVARFYDPFIAHFIQADSISPSAGSTQGLNRYAYVQNNPIRYNDPSGHKPCDEEDGCGDSKKKSTVGGTTTNSVAIYWNGYTEAKLASFQQKQTGNNCALNAISAGFGLLGYPLAKTGNELGAITNKKGIRYRMYTDGGTLPFQQKNIINNISSLTGQSSIPVQARVAGINDIHYATQNLSDSSMVMLYTFYWAKTNPPEISNKSRITLDNSSIVNGHTMVYVAYDPGHVDAKGNSTPYGFLNSWESNATTISWMSENDVSDRTAGLVIMQKNNNP